MKNIIRNFISILPMLEEMKEFEKDDSLAGVNIQKEYELIKQKKSTLSAAQRKMVVCRWENRKNN